MADAYKLFLKELSDHLTSSDVNTIKFLCGSDLPAGIAENILTAIDLLIAMDRAHIISKDNLRRLRRLFDAIPRRDLISKIDQFSRTRQFSNSNNAKSPIESNMDPPVLNVNMPRVPNNSSPSADVKTGKGASKDFSSDVKISKLTSISPNNIVLMTPSDFTKKLRFEDKTSTSSSIENLDITDRGAAQLPTRNEHPPMMSRQKSYLNAQLEEYSMQNYPHGNCIIFSNQFKNPVNMENGKSLTERHGTEKDVTLLTKTFNWLGFSIDVYRDQSGSEMISALKEIAKQQVKESTDCFVCCILSHGFEGGVYGNDGSKLPTNQLLKIFEGNNCKSLIDKPKLIFIQACQGEADGMGVSLQSDAPSPITQDHYEKEISVDGSEAVVLEQIIATDADFLIFLATTPGKTAWRDPMNGSWFIQILCSVFQEHAMHLNLMDMLLLVNNKIAFKEAPIYNGRGIAKEMSNCGKNTMRKNLMFYPKCEFDSNISVKFPSEL